MVAGEGNSAAAVALPELRKFADGDRHTAVCLFACLNPRHADYDVSELEQKKNAVSCGFQPAHIFCYIRPCSRGVVPSIQKDLARL